MSRQADSRITGGKRDGGQFPTTHWSLVLRAGDAASATGREALDALLRKYNAPLRVHLIRVRRITPDDAEDILQDFVAGKILRRGIVARARRADGRFRTFILTALDRFACSWYRARNAAKRRPQEMLPLDENAAAVAGSAGSGEAFDVAWAREVVNQAVQRMQAECSRTGRPDLWALFECRVLKPAMDDDPPLPYDGLVARFHLESPAQAQNLLVTAKRMYARCLQSVIAEYALDEKEVSLELRDLFRILSAARA